MIRLLIFTATLIASALFHITLAIFLPLPAYLAVMLLSVIALYTLVSIADD